MGTNVNNMSIWYTDKKYIYSIFQIIIKKICIIYYKIFQKTYVIHIQKNQYKKSIFFKFNKNIKNWK